MFALYIFLLRLFSKGQRAWLVLTPPHVDGLMLYLGNSFRIHCDTEVSSLTPSLILFVLYFNLLLTGVLYQTELHQLGLVKGFEPLTTPTKRKLKG